MPLGTVEMSPFNLGGVVMDRPSFVRILFPVVERRYCTKLVAPLVLFALLGIVIV